jgi:hypothetical protein
MKSKVAKVTMLVSVALLMSGLPYVVSAGHIKPNPKAVAGGLSAVANQLNLKPTASMHMSGQRRVGIWSTTPLTRRRPRRM